MVPMMSCETIKAALALPTLAQAAKRLGEDEMLIMLTGAIEQAMQMYFSEEQRMSPAMCAAFADNLLSDYRYESIGDARVFIKRASMGRYGEIDPRTKEIINKGKTYGRITMTLLGSWWEQYLNEKAEEAEKERLAENRALNGLRHDAADGISDALLSAMKKAHADAEKDMDDKDTGRRVGLLMRTVAHMGDARLRYAWKKARTERERMVVIQEANKRGLVQKRIEEHLSKLETPKP